MRSSAALSCLLWLACAVAQEAPAAPPPATVAKELLASEDLVCGRLESHGELRLLRVWGTPEQRGYAHGYLLADEVARIAIAEFTARFAEQPGLLKIARDSVARLIEMPPDVAAMLDGLYRGLLDRKIDLRMERLGRDFDRKDLLIANSLDVFGLMGCSGFAVWGDQVAGGGVLSARNFDWPFTGAHMLDGTLLLVEHLPDGRALCSVTWPGFVATVTGINSDGLAVYLHVGTGKVTLTPEPSSWPTAVAARAILQQLGGKPAAAAAIAHSAQELLGHTSPPAGFLTRLVLPDASAAPPAFIFETDARRCVLGEPGAAYCVTTNHFATRTDGRPASADSKDREQKLQQCLAAVSDPLTVADAWQALVTVQRGGPRFGTLHALVFRHQPWCFELAIGGLDGKNCVAAPSSGKKHSLPREALFPAEVPTGPVPAAKR